MIALAALVLDLVPLPVKAWRDQTMVCMMNHADGISTSLTIALRYEKANERDGYWWTITGNDLLYPSNKTARNMFSYEYGGADRSLVYFEHGGRQYTYTLYYHASADTFPSFVPDHLTVSSRPYASDAALATPVGIGFCTSKKIEDSK